MDKGAVKYYNYIYWKFLFEATTDRKYRKLRRWICGPYSTSKLPSDIFIIIMDYAIQVNHARKYKMCRIELRYQPPVEFTFEFIRSDTVETSKWFMPFKKAQSLIKFIRNHSVVQIKEPDIRPFSMRFTYYNALDHVMLFYDKKPRSYPCIFYGEVAEMKGKLGVPSLWAYPMWDWCEKYINFLGNKNPWPIITIYCIPFEN